MKQKTYKKFNECKKGDTLYCIKYKGPNYEIKPLTIKEIVTDGPNVENGIYSKEAIIIKEKVPNSTEPKGKYVIDQYYRGDECASHSYGIFTTYEECLDTIILKLNSNIKSANKDIRKYQKLLNALNTSLANYYKLKKAKKQKNESINK